MSDTKLTAAELQRMADALPPGYYWGDPLDAYQLREILSAMGYFDLIEALQAITDQLERIGDTRPHKDWQYIETARAALAKALGSTS